MANHSNKIPDEEVILAHYIAAFFAKDSSVTAYAKTEIANLYANLSQDEEIGPEVTRKLFLEIANGKPHSPSTVKKPTSDREVKRKLIYIFKYLKSRGSQIGFHVGIYSVASALQRNFPGVYAKRGRGNNADKLEAEAIGQKLERYFPKEPK